MEARLANLLGRRNTRGWTNKEHKFASKLGERIALIRGRRVAKAFRAELDAGDMEAAHTAVFHLQKKSLSSLTV